MVLRVSRRAVGAGVSLQAQLYRQLAEQLDSGALAEGARLPAARVMARQLRVSRNTVDAVLARLQAEGRIVRRVGSGSAVARSAPQATLRVHQERGTNDG